MAIKSIQLQQKNRTPQVRESSGKPEFPTARYFQIHFEHLESQLDETRHCLQSLQQQVAELYLRLSVQSPELIPSAKDKK